MSTSSITTTGAAASLTRKASTVLAVAGEVQALAEEPDAFFTDRSFSTRLSRFHGVIEVLRRSGILSSMTSKSGSRTNSKRASVMIFRACSRDQRLALMQPSRRLCTMCWSASSATWCHKVLARSRRGCPSLPLTIVRRLCTCSSQRGQQCLPQKPSLHPLAAVSRHLRHCFLTCIIVCGCCRSEALLILSQKGYRPKTLSALAVHCRTDFVLRTA